MRRAVLCATVVTFGSGLVAFTGSGSAAASENGRIAFASLRESGWDIFTMQPDGEGVRQLTSDRAQDLQPAWSPDGKTIAFATTYRHGSPFAQIWTMSARGDQRVALTDIADGNAQEPAWSPDGDRVAFHVVYGGSVDSEIFIMNADGSDLSQLTDNQRDDSDPAWAPDGSRIAFVRNGEIKTMSPAGKAVRPITPDGVSAFEPAWSPSGGALVFSGWKIGNRVPDLFTIDADGSNVFQLTASPRWESSPAWSPDGRRIAYALESPSLDLARVMTVRIDGTHRRVLSESAEPRDYWPHWRDAIDQHPDPS